MYRNTHYDDCRKKKSICTIPPNPLVTKSTFQTTVALELKALLLVVLPHGDLFLHTQQQFSSNRLCCK